MSVVISDITMEMIGVCRGGGEMIGVYRSGGDSIGVYIMKLVFYVEDDELSSFLSFSMIMV